MKNTFKFTADTINGVIQLHPQQFILQCNKIVPIGSSIVRNFDGNECIEAMKVFLILYDGKLLGNKCYTSLDEFVTTLQGVCVFDFLLLDNCPLVLDDLNLNLN